MTEQELEDYYEGKGCICYAHNINDCACSHADWTPKEVYVLRNRVEQLETALINAMPIVKSAYKQHWDNAYDSFIEIEGVLKNG